MVTVVDNFIIPKGFSLYKNYSIIYQTHVKLTAMGSKKNALRPWVKKQWCIPPEASVEFVSAMEAILEIYYRPEDRAHPVVCVDETSKQHIKETRQPLPMAFGMPSRYEL